jgi:hypothetical protein
MDAFLERLFVSEILHQCQFALMAYDDITTGLATHDTTKLFYSIQGFLIACANISKIFWPQSAQYTQLGNALKLLLSVDDISPLKQLEQEIISNILMNDWTFGIRNHNIIISWT